MLQHLLNSQTAIGLKQRYQYILPYAKANQQNGNLLGLGVFFN